jgi:tetratricopeptide (TPR) repeat protein
VPAALLLLLAVSAASADTIVLKNGRRIVASNVVEANGRVSYETPAGELAIPQSIVARIERNDLAPTSLADSAPPVSAPRVDVSAGYADAAAGAIRDSSVDTAYLFHLEIDARGGDPTAVAKVAAAHHAAAQFLLAKGDLDGAAAHYREALTFAPDNVPLLLNLAMIDLRESEFTTALEPLEHARRIEPDSADVAKLMGWAYYGANKLDQAVAEWKRAQQLRPDEEVASALAKAERDRQEEAGYREGETSHFSLKYSGAAAPDLAREILHVLEDHFRDLESQLDYTPPERIGVILYTNEAFADITRAPGWAGAINDGRIRVPVQGLTAVTSDLSRVLKHELTHSFVGQKTRGRAPTWLQEGLAQWMEGRRSRDAASALVQIADKKAAEPFGQMEGSWMGLSGDSATYSYAWSLAAVESIIREGGMSDIEKLLDRIATEPSTELALQDSLRMSYAGLAQQTTSYLRHEYLR